MAESRSEFLARIAEEHYAWEGQQLDTAPFEPDDPENAARPDYNMWYADMTPDPDAQQQFVAAIGTPDYVDDGTLPDTDEESDVDAPEQDHGGG